MPTAATHFLADHGPTLLAGATALLAAGAVGTLVTRSPVHRQRISELALLATLAWVVLACVPMRRIEWRNSNRPVESATAPIPLTVNDIPSELLAGNPPTPPAVSGRTARPERSRRGGAGSPPADGAPDATIATLIPSHNVPHRLTQLYLAGGAAALAWLVLGHVLLRRLTRRASPAPEHVVRMIDARLRPACRQPRVLVSPTLARPFTCGALRPTILLPAALLAHDRRPLLRQVLLHELGHVHQRDGWGCLLFNLALPLLYAHPLYWLLRRTTVLSRELVADDWAARADGKDAYVGELVALARAATANARIGPVGAIGILQTPSHFYRRMHMLLQRPHPLATRCSTLFRASLALLTLGAVVTAAALGGARPALAQEPAPAATPHETKPAARADGDSAELRALRSERDALAARVAALEEKMTVIQSTSASKRPSPDAPGREPGVQSTKEFAPTGSGTRAPAASGKPGPGLVGGRPAGESPYAPAMAAIPPAAGAGAVRGVQVDLVNLANTLVDAAGGVRLAKVQLENAVRAEKLGTQGVGDRATAEAALITAQKRFELLRSIAEVSLESAQNDAARAKQHAEHGVASVQDAEQAVSKVRMLELIIRGAN